MTYAHLHALHTPFTAETFPYPGRLGRALGADCAEAWQLLEEIKGDLDRTGLGIRWWAPATPMPARALIADQLVVLTKAIHKNLVEARLHQIEGDSTWAQIRARDAEPRPMRGISDFAGRQPTTPVDELPDALLELHMAGFFRAIGSAIDCLGGALVGVLGLKTPILRADYGRAVSALERLTQQTRGSDALRAAFLPRLRSLESASGPPAWLKWSVHMRNMLVHRGRRLQVFHPTVEPMGLLSPAGDQLVRVRPHWFLPRSPGLSEIEEMVTAGGPAALTLRIPHTDVLSQIMDAALKFSRALSRELVDMWRLRRGQPDLIHQPPEQWPRFPSDESPGFGCTGVALDPGGILSGRELELRLHAAAVDDARREAVWRQHLGTPAPGADGAQIGA